MSLEMIRAKVQAVTEGVIKRFSALGRAGERFVNREYFQHYGFTSRPLDGSEKIVLKQGNVVIAIASDDRRYRIAVDAGEVAIYTDEGDFIHLLRGRTIYVNSGGTVLIEGASEVTVNTAAAQVNASGSVEVTTPEATVTAPAISLDGNVEISGTLTVAGIFTGQGVTAGNGSISVTDDIHAGGDITCVGSNPNHHTHS